MEERGREQAPPLAVRHAGRADVRERARGLERDQHAVLPHAVGHEDAVVVDPVARAVDRAADRELEA